MRAIILVLSLAACFGAQASSIITLGGTPAAAPSIISLGEPAPAVSNDKVAAIPKAPEASLPPMVIRGGVAGGVSAEPSPQPASREPAAATAKPKPVAAPQQAAASADSSPSASESGPTADTTPAAPASAPLHQPM